MTPTATGLVNLLARAYLRLLSGATNRPTNGQLEGDADSSEFDSEALDYSSGKAMKCHGRDPNPLARKD